MTSKPFKYIFVPVDITAGITELLGDLNSGLQNDDLRVSAERHFCASSGGSSNSVEIVSLMLPCAANGFIGVSMYCDQNGKAKNQELNSRATSFAHLCGYTSMTVHGDAFFGRYHDDESMEWERLDFSADDLSSDANWVKEAQRMNYGKKMGGATTSGLLQNMLKSNNTAVIDGDKEAMETVQEDHNPFLSWSQTSDEIEVRVKVTGLVKASDLDIKTRSKHLQVVPKTSYTKLEPWTSSMASLHAVMTGDGAELWGNVDPDSSAWTLDKGQDGDATVVLTLAKTRNGSWPKLTA
jgi:hypothetical protein